MSAMKFEFRYRPREGGPPGLRILAMMVLILSQNLENSCQSVSCSFNRMCQCWVQDDSEFTKMDVSCVGVPFARFPEISVSYVAQLDIIGSGLQVLENDALAGSSVEAFGLTSNKLSNIGDKSLLGVANSLRSLDLSYNCLEEVPFAAFHALKKLGWLNLHSNRLTSLEGDWSHLRETLTNAFFGDNSISELPESFSGFESLLWLNLDNNNIQDLRSSSLPPKLHTLSLNSNLLKSFPRALATLKNLNWLYLRGNAIRSLELPGFQSPELEVVDLSDNSIEVLTLGVEGSENDLVPAGKNRSLKVHDLNLGSNRIRNLPADVFLNLEAKRIHLSSNGMKVVHEDAFRGLEESLEYLNLESNELLMVPSALSRTKRISYLYLAGNGISNVSQESFFSFADRLKALSLASNNLKAVPVDALSRCGQLLHLNLGYNKIAKVVPGDFGWASNLEILLLRNNLLSKLKPASFAGAGKLKELSLSFNQLSLLDDEAFLGVEDTLEILELSFAFTTDVFPQRALRPLSNLLWLVLDNNNFQTIEPTAFYMLPRLRYINLESNRLYHLPVGTFLGSIHEELRDIKLGYNFIEEIPPATFHNLTELRSLDLTGNRIRVLSSGSIQDCLKLVTVSMAYNEISKIEPSALARLPGLRFLHLEFNRLVTLEIGTVIDTGASADFSLNVSYNAIARLVPATSSGLQGRTDLQGLQGSQGLYSPFGHDNCSLVRLDISHNNLSTIPADVFTAVPCLRYLDLRHNVLTGLEPGTLGLSHLESLYLADNRLDLGNGGVLKRQALHGLSGLQRLDLAGNNLSHLAGEQFKYVPNLRILDLSRNRLRTLPRDVFLGTRLEILDLSENRLTSVPSSALLELGFTLRDLNLAGNFVDRLDSSAFPVSLLTSLDLARNRLTILPDNSFVSLGKLLTLNVSHNNLEANYKELFHYLPDLRRLDVGNCGLGKVPILPLLQLSYLDLSCNNIATVSGKDFPYLNVLKVLVLTNNSLTRLSENLKLPLLRELDVSGNPIQELTKESFSGYPRLEVLNLKNLGVTRSVDKDTLRTLRYLKHLRIQTWPRAEGVQLRQLVGGLPLRTVEVQVTERQLKNQLENAFTKQLRELLVTGRNLEVISSEAFSSLEGGSELVLRIRDTGVRRLQPDIFLSLTKRLSQLTLDLRDNHINELSPSVIYGNLSWEAVGTNIVAGGLQVSGNPLECDCEIAWLSLWLRRWLRESRQIHTASQSDARQLRNIAGRAVCTETTPSYSSDKVLLTMGTPRHTACQASALSSGNDEHARTWMSCLQILALVLLAN
ncbi:chaoptin [Orussus abietinus]|uniref:chaoptin n=1 Tax=Orussus abietinus TaxID=222816 RepID=UPI0006256BC7|nr:chaoptin [Orussus abietinus]